MKLSWSHKLFLRINAWQGKSRFLDSVMVFAAHWLIYILAALVFLGVYLYVPELARTYALLMMVAVWGIAIGVSYLIAMFLPHPRPHVEFPSAKSLLPLYHFEEWKSFPSDHTLSAFLFVFIAIGLGVSWLFGITLVVLASLIAMARVYVGVHYPRDIVGGLALAVLFFLIWKFFFVT